MTPSSEFIAGLKILEPFLFQHGFKLDYMKTQQSSGGQFTNAAYINGKKKFIIGYRYSVGLLDYQFENSTVMHNFYLDGLGYADKKQYPDFQNEDLQSSFRHILADFEYLKDDFFIGHCIELKKIAISQIKYYEELQAKLYADEELKSNKEIIDKARQQFKVKNYKACIDFYKTVSKNYVLTEFDKRTLQHCNDHRIN
ncbi:MAG TPA: hypothetical protein VGP55_02120 [Chitinophagaceae bacterium]|nr:hypothetical protein [Chitinophagaceae bacterium]